MVDNSKTDLVEDTKIEPAADVKIGLAPAILLFSAVVLIIIILAFFAGSISQSQWSQAEVEKVKTEAVNAGVAHWEFDHRTGKAKFKFGKKEKDH